MYFLNFSAGQFLALMGAVSAIVTAFYFFDRTRKQIVVSTMRFWQEAGQLPSTRSKRRVQHPWSLLLQLLSLLLLLLAIGQLQLGIRQRPVRNHVLLLDTSSATLTASGKESVLDEEKQLATSYLQRLPATDRVMLVRLDGLLTPATLFTNDRAQLTRAIQDSRSSLTAVDIARTLTIAAQLQVRADGEPGEIVYTGPEQLNGDSEPNATATLPSLRILPLRSNSNLANCGFRAVRLASNDGESGRFAEAVLKNYGTSRRLVTVTASMGQTALTPQRVSLLPGEQVTVPFLLGSRAGAPLRLELSPHDAFPLDDSASLTIGEAKTPRLIAYTNRPEGWKPFVEANPRLAVSFLNPSAYDATVKADALLFDRFVPKQLPSSRILVVDPPPNDSPVPIQQVVSGQTLQGWTPLEGRTSGLHGEDSRLATTKVFRMLPTDTALASVPAGPVVVERIGTNDSERMAVIGFDPLSAPFRFQVTSPLLLANVLKWLLPEAFPDASGGNVAVGLVHISLEPGETRDNVQVTDERGQAVAYTLRDRTIEIYAGQRGSVRLHSPGRDQTFVLELPEYASVRWHSARARRGLPSYASAVAVAHDLWKGLAAAAAVLLALEWFLFGRRKRLSLVLKIATLGLILIALIVPPLVLERKRVAAAALVDNSGSISGTELETARDFVRRAQSVAGQNRVLLSSFAAHPHMPPERTGSAAASISRAPGVEGGATNIEAALEGTPAVFPDGFLPRMVLISDGNENEGSAVRAMAQLRQLQIPVDVVPLDSRPSRHISVLSATLPARAYSNEPVPIDLTVQSPAAAPATVYLFAGDKKLGVVPVKLREGNNSLRVHARIDAAGALAVTVRVDAGSFGTGELTQAMQMKRAAALYVSDDPPGTEANLMGALSAAHLDVLRTQSIAASALGDYQLLVLNNLDLQIIPDSTKAVIEQYVRDGGGLLLISGEKQVYKEKKQQDSLDRALPADIAPPETPEGISVALIVDKSSSMEGRKIELARTSASGVVDHLRPTDTIGVLMFDNSYQWAVPMRKATDKNSIKKLIAGITPDGGTQIAPALAEAYRQVVSSKGSFRHIVLLTDGISEEGDSMELAKEALLHQVTISTVGLGQDVNRWYLEKIASTSGGRSYFLNQPQGLEQILLKDVRDYSGQTSVEKALLPMVDEKAEILRGTGMESAPPLKGYVRFEPKTGAQTLLSINPDKKDPLYVRWQYGLGRAAVFTSDAKARWAAGWIGWPGFDKFWINAARDLLAQNGQVEGTAAWDSADNQVTVRYELPAGREAPRQAPALFLLGSHGFARQFFIVKTGERTYEGKVSPGNETGLLRIRPLVDSRSFPEVGVYRKPPEFDVSGADTHLLQQLAASTGGRYRPTPEQIFDTGGRTQFLRWEIWPFLLAFAILLDLIELAARKLRRPSRGRFSTSQTSGRQVAA